MTTSFRRWPYLSKVSTKFEKNSTNCCDPRMSQELPLLHTLFVYKVPSLHIETLIGMVIFIVGLPLGVFHMNCQSTMWLYTLPTWPLGHLTKDLTTDCLENSASGNKLALTVTRTSKMILYDNTDMFCKTLRETPQFSPWTSAKIWCSSKKKLYTPIILINKITTMPEYGHCQNHDNDSKSVGIILMNIVSPIMTTLFNICLAFSMASRLDFL